MLSLIEPNIHPILVHFAYALSITATGLYVLSKIAFASNRLPVVRQSADLILGLAALSVLLTVAAGFQAYFTVGHDGPSHEAMTIHRNWALAAATFLLAIAIWRWIKRAAEPSLTFVGAMLVSALLFTTAAWWGGHIVYGYGLGVQQLPAISGEGHDHHGDSGGHDHGAPAETHDVMQNAKPAHDHDGNSISIPEDPRFSEEAAPDEPSGHHPHEDGNAAPHSH